MPFRSVLLAVILGLILASTLATAWLGLSGFRVVTRQIMDRQITLVLDAVTRQIEELFDPSKRLLDLFAAKLRAGALPLDRPEELALAFAEVLPFEDDVAWLSFGYADGRFAGARRDGQGATINLSEPGGGSPREYAVEDGVPRRIERPALPSGYDARTRPWFQDAVSQEGVVWTPPYEFASGGTGITASKALRDADGELIGVLTVDFLLADIAAQMDALRDQFHGDTLVFSISGHILAKPSGGVPDASIEKVRQIMVEEGGVEELRALGGSIIRDVRLNGWRCIVGLRAAKIPGNLNCVSAIIFDRDETFGAVETVVRRSVLAGAGALAIALVVGFVLAGRIATPLRQLSAEVTKIRSFELGSGSLPKSKIREVQTLSESTEGMRSSLKSFAHYVPVDIVRDLVRGGGVAALGGERREVTVLFADLAGFTAYSERVSPEVSVAVLTAYFEAFGRAISEQGGAIDKFQGDGIMALFDAPRRIPNPSASACRAALHGVAAARASEPLAAAAFSIRVGIERGEALVGNIGTPDRFAYTAIGDCVNLGSRLESLNKHFGTTVLAGAAVREVAGEEEFVWRSLGAVAVAGRNAPVAVHELVGFRAVVGGAVADAARAYGMAVERAAAGDLAGALRIVAECPTADAALETLGARLRQAAADPGRPWEAVLRFTEK